METQPGRQDAANLNDNPVVEQDAGTKTLTTIEETLRPADDVPESESERTGTHRDQTGDDDTMATES